MGKAKRKHLRLKCVNIKHDTNMWNRVPSVVKTHYPASQNQKQNFTKINIQKNFS